MTTATLFVTQGEPYRRTLLFDGDQHGNSALFDCAPRGTPAGTAPTLTSTLTLELVAPTVPPTTVGTLDLDEAAVALLIPGVVYVYHIRVNEGTAVVQGELECLRRWG